MEYQLYERNNHHKTPIIKKNVQKTTTKPVKCKAKTHDIKHRQGKTTRFNVWIKDNKNKHVNNLKLKIKRVYKGHTYTSYIRTSSGKGIKLFNNLGAGTHKIFINSADSKYKVSATAKITIINTKKTVLKNIYFNTNYQRDYYKKIGKHSYLDVYFNDDNFRYYVDLTSDDGYKFKKVITFW